MRRRGCMLTECRGSEQWGFHGLKMKKGYEKRPQEEVVWIGLDCGVLGVWLNCMND